MARSIWKGPFSDLKIIKKENDKSTYSSHSLTQRENSPSTIRLDSIVRVWSRRSQILPAQAGKKLLVHNGRAFINVTCTESMCSRRYGEFAVTRKKVSHKLSKRKQLHRNIK